MNGLYEYTKYPGNTSSLYCEIHCYARSQRNFVIITKTIVSCSSAKTVTNSFVVVVVALFLGQCNAEI